MLTGSQVEGVQGRMLLIIYTYNDIIWDDITLLVNMAVTQIIDIPNSTRILTMDFDRKGRNIIEFKNNEAAGEAKPEIIKAVTLF